MEFRKAKLRDVPAIAKMGMELLDHHAKFGAYFLPAKNAKSLYIKHFERSVYSRNRLLLVCEDKGKLVAYALAEVSSRSPMFREQRIGVLSDAYVKKSHRRKGIAKQFLKQIYPWFRSKKIKHVELNVYADNASGRKAWRRCGFKLHNIRKLRKL